MVNLSGLRQTKPFFSDAHLIVDINVPRWNWKLRLKLKLDHGATAIDFRLEMVKSAGRAFGPLPNLIFRLSVIASRPDSKANNIGILITFHI